MKTINELRETAVKVTSNMEIFWPQSNKTERYTPSHLIEGTYYTNNGIIAFVSNNNLYVTPYCADSMKIILDNAFVKEHMYVPFSNWDYPVAEKSKWQNLLHSAKEKNRLDFIAECKDYSLKSRFGIIDESLLEKCMEIPIEGIAVTHFYYKSTIYPQITNSYMDCTVAEKLCTYHTNNGTIVFVHSDGKTYVTRNFDVLSELRSAGYREKGMHVPLSNGESIDNYWLANKWKALAS
ncbi:MAG: hypothetical protein PHR25_05305 [Clostridia bacterium]|nr:hypothetical protein [Clostridia bacterium]MDD4376182.1 hypothetical protein [Clostridia bacterium]